MITGPASYVPTTNEFLAHWLNANAVQVLVVASGVVGVAAKSRTDLALLRDDLLAERAAVQGALNQASVARESLAMQKRALLVHFDEFAALLRAYFGASEYLTSLPLKPTEGEMSARFVDTMTDMLSLWAQVNAGTAPAGITLPLLLPGGTERDDVVPMVEGLQDALELLSQKEQNTDLARARRNIIQEKIYPILRDYRLAVPAVLGKASPLTATLPRLSPLPGKTPSAVNASGTFQTPANVAKIVYTESPDEDVTHYELRQCPPPDYQGEDETIIATNDAGDAREFLTNAGLLAPGDRSLYKIYAVNAEGRERGSNVVDITWPT